MKPKKWTREFTEALVKESRSISEVVTRSGAKWSGGMHRMVSNYISRYEIDISHFTGKLWAKGKTREQDPRIRCKSDDEVFVLNGTSNQPTVRRRFKKVSNYFCEICKTAPVWNGNPLTLHMDHINGNPSDSRLENLRWLCPNCHSQTETYSNAKRLD